MCVCELFCFSLMSHKDCFGLDFFHTSPSTWLCWGLGAGIGTGRADQQGFSNQRRYLGLHLLVGWRSHSSLCWTLWRRVEQSILGQDSMTFENGGLKGIGHVLVALRDAACLAQFAIGQVFDTSSSNGLEGCLVLLPFQTEQRQVHQRSGFFGSTFTGALPLLVSFGRC